MLTKSGDPHHP